MNNATLFAMIERLEKSENELEVKEVCQSFCEEISFEYYLCGVCTITSLSSPEYSTLTNYPSSWFDSYFESGLQKHDPVVKYCFDQITPVRWDKLIKMEQYMTPEGMQVMQCAGENGLVNGISVPYKSLTGEISVFSLSTCSESDIDNRMLKALAPAQAFGTALFQNIHRIKKNSPCENEQKGVLTARETECLFWACEGKTTWEISKILEISERTIVFHLTSATKKLGATNRQHAVAKAIINGLVKPKP